MITQTLQHISNSSFLIIQCGLKGDDCSVPSDCCGSQKYDCQDGTCCILTGLNGCGKDSDCCSGSCDLMLALCYEKLN